MNDSIWKTHVFCKHYDIKCKQKQTNILIEDKP